MNQVSARDNALRERLVEVALDWERQFGVAPAITSALSEFDAAMLVGHTQASFGQTMAGVTVVRKGFDFEFQGLRYQVKGHRPSGKPGSMITNAGKVKNVTPHDMRRGRRLG